MNKKYAKRVMDASKKSKIILLLFAVGFAAIGAYLILQTSAAPKPRSEAAVTLYVSPGSQQVSVGQTLQLAIKLNTNNQDVNAIQADLSYPADKFEFVKIDGANSLFNIDASSTGGNGTISIARGNLTSVNSTDALIATVHLKALSSGRRASVSFNDSSAILRASDNTNILAKKISGQYTIK